MVNISTLVSRRNYKKYSKTVKWKKKIFKNKRKNVTHMMHWHCDNVEHQRHRCFKQVQNSSIAIPRPKKYFDSQSKAAL